MTKSTLTYISANKTLIVVALIAIISNMGLEQIPKWEQTQHIYSGVSSLRKEGTANTGNK